MSLHFTGSRYLPMGDNTFMWVQVTSYGFEDGSDTDLLAEMVASDQYAYDYASPFEASARPRPDAVHARWWRDRITPKHFVACSVADAREAIRSWSDDNWVEPDYRLPTAALEHLAGIRSRLAEGTLYRLDNPGEEDEHEYGFVTGGCGFHEFVVIDRATSTLDLIVATDD